MVGAVYVMNEPVDKSVGARIRRCRKAGTVSLKTVAQRTGLSIGYLSQIERGISSPSLRAVALVADALAVDFATLFPRGEKADPGDAVVFKSGDRLGMPLDLVGVRKELLTPGGSGGGLRLYLMTIEPGGHSGENFYAHSGEEAGTVLEGDFELTVETEVFRLTAQDSFRFRSRRPHRWRNVGTTVCRVLWSNAT
jgi:transcriptional regulator with XRE-family HTH domain